MNTRDSEVIAGLMTQAGYAVTETPEDAGVVIFNTCSVRQHAEDKVWSEIGRMAHERGRKSRGSSSKDGGRPQHSLRPSTANFRPIIGLVGCMAQNYKDGAFKRSPHIDFVVGPADIAKIPEIVGRLIRVKKDEGSKTRDGRGSRPSVVPLPSSPEHDPLFKLKVWETDGLVRPEDIYHTGYHAEKDHAYVVVSEGCVNYCAYCVVPYTRGELRHRPRTEILREITEAVASGITRVTLLGQNVNAYRSPVERGRPKGVEGKKEAETGFVQLLEDVNAIPGLEEFSFITSHPRDTSEELFAAMARLDKLKKYLHLPVQSGSNRVLAAMSRGYTREFYLDLAGKYRTMVPDGALTTDIIVGFPGESEDDFRQTVDLVESVCFDSAYVFKYSVRPHTTAASLPDDVPQAEKERRHAHVLALQKKISLKRKGRPLS